MFKNISRGKIIFRSSSIKITLFVRLSELRMSVFYNYCPNAELTIAHYLLGKAFNLFNSN